MTSRIRTIAFSGIDCLDVDVQVQIAAGLPAFTLVGLPDKAVAESRERVRASLHALGLALPGNGTVVATHADRRRLFDTYRFADTARKVVGVGSVGLDARIALFTGRDGADPLFLQMKEARPSVLAAYAGASPYRHQGERVVQGQRLMQAARQDMEQKSFFAEH